MKQIPILIGDDGKMRIKHGSIALILIQLFVISAIVGALSPTVSTTRNEANTTTSNPDFPELPAGEEVGFEQFDRVDDFGPEFVPGEVLVKFRKSLSVGLTNGIVTTGIASVDELNKRFEVKGIERIFSNVYKLKLPKDADILSVVKEYEADPNVEYAEPNGILHEFAVPNDPEYWRQWAHEVTEAELAWNITTGSPNVVLAIVDSGVDWDHPDLAANIWNNTDEEIGDANGDGYPGVAGVDDDGDGYIDEDSNNRQPGEEGYTNDLVNDDDENGFNDDIRGWDFVSVDQSMVWPGEDPGPRDNDPMDFHGHGTHCAGIAAAVTNNTIGVAGTSWNCKIMAVRAGFRETGGAGNYNSDDAALAISYAANNSANIISMSFGGGYSSTIYESVNEAYEKGVLLVAAAGNSFTNKIEFPAVHSEVIAVAATDAADDPAFFTNFGSIIEVAAPGVDIYSTICDNSYAYKSGTSMSCPYVAGVAALIWSRFPNMTRDEVRYQLRNTTDDLGDLGFDFFYGYGRVNARWAIDHDSPEHDLRAWGLQAPGIMKPGTTATINCTVLNFGKNNESDVYVKLLVNGEEIENKTINSIESYEWATVSFSWTPTGEGWYNVTSFVVPVEGESFVGNNNKSTRVPVRVEEVVWVPEDYSTIQRAVSAANSGYTVQVASGTYYEHVRITKSLTLIGEESSTITIDGSGTGDVVAMQYAHGYYPCPIENVTISRLTIQNGDCGIHLYGTYLKNCRYISVSGNTFSNNNYGIYLYYSDDSSVSGNTFSNNNYGVYLDTSSNNNIIYHNNFIDNTNQATSPGGTNVWDDGYPSGGNYWSDYTDVDQYSGPYQNETGSDGIWDHPYIIDGKNRDNYPLMGPPIMVPQDYPTIQTAINAASPGNTIYVSSGTYYEHVVVDKSLTITGEDPSTTIIDGNGTGNVVTVQSNNVQISQFTIQNGEIGTYLEYSNNTSVSDNIVLNNDLAIYLLHSSSNTVSGNTVSDNNKGIYLFEYSENNIVSGNTVINNGYASTDAGIYLHRSRHNTVSGNTVSNNTKYGIYLYLSQDTEITENEISNNTHGLRLYNCESSEYNCIIYHNNFINNSEAQASRYGSPYLSSTWDDGYPSGGNYWNDYTGDDEFSGPNQDQPGSDGIGDTPYVIDENNQDNYPLMWPVHEVAVTDVTATPTEVRIGNSVSVIVTVMNQGTESETFNVTAYYNSNAIGTQTVTNLATRDSTTLTFTWDTTGVPPGNYTISAQASTVPGETDTADNTYVDGTVEIYWVHDVAVTDIMFVLPYGATAVYPGWVIDVPVTVRNEGDYSETFDVTAYYDSPYYGSAIIGTQSVSLSPDAETTLTFVWDTTGVSPGHAGLDYTISAEANVVSGETDTADNTYVDGTLTVKYPGDVDGDGDVDDADLAIWQEAYGRSYPDPAYNPHCDFNGDGIIDVYDLQILSANYGHDPTQIRVPQDYPTIQTAINAASPGNTIYVSSGTYYEHVVVDKSLTLVGEDPSTTIIDGSGAGYIVTVQANNVSISQFTIQNGKYGIYLEHSNYNLISGNIVTNNEFGIKLASSNYNSIYGNNITANNYYGIYGVAYGYEVYGSSNNNITDNVITDNDSSGIRLYKGSYNVITGNTLTNNGDGITVLGNYTIVSENYIAKSWMGIWMYGTVFNTISNNTISEIAQYGIGMGIGLARSSNSTLTYNTIFSTEIGIWLHDSSNNILASNKVSNNSNFGIKLEQSSDNTVRENTLSNNGYGVYLDTSSNNVIYHNNFVNNTNQAYVSPGGTNAWDDSYPSGGNFWSDYNGTDWYSGPYQNETSNDGIGDAPYVINQYSQDNYPLMSPWPVHDVAVTDVTATPTEVRIGNSVSVIVTVRNQGTESETFNVTAYYDSNVIGTQSVIDLAPRDSEILTFPWDTTGLNLGVYTIKAVASIVPNETDTADNTKIDGTVTIWAWDLLDEPWNQLDGWTKEGKGQSEIQTLDGKSCLYNKPDRSKYVTQRKDIGSLPETGYTVETSLYINSWGTGGSEAFVAFKFYDGMHLVTIEIHSDRVVGPQNQFSLETQIQRWYTWRFVIDSDADTIYAYRDGQYVGTLTGLTDSTANDGLVYCSWTQNPKGSSGCKSYTDYIKIATGLYTPS